MKIEDLKIGDEVFVKGVVSDKTFNIHGNKKFKIRTTPFEDINGFVAKNKLILQDQPKPEIPQFVADKYEEFKHDFENFLINLCWESRAFESVFNSSDFGKWFKNSENTPLQTLINMHQFGYTVKKEKLYTVEIPNPHEKQLSFVLMRKPGGNISINVVYSSNLDLLKTDNDLQLTEKEIKKDFDWAFRWAEEVTE